MAARYYPDSHALVVHFHTRLWRLTGGRTGRAVCRPAGGGSWRTSRDFFPFDGWVPRVWHANRSPGITQWCRHHLADDTLRKHLMLFREGRWPMLSVLSRVPEARMLDSADRNTVYLIANLHRRWPHITMRQKVSLTRRVVRSGAVSVLPVLELHKRILPTLAVLPREMLQPDLLDELHSTLAYLPRQSLSLRSSKDMCHTAAAAHGQGIPQRPFAEKCW